MFIWFVFRDSPDSAWQSGLYREDGSPKPAQTAWPTAVGPLNARNGKVTARGGTSHWDACWLTRKLIQSHDRAIG